MVVFYFWPTHTASSPCSYEQHCQGVGTSLNTLLPSKHFTDAGLLNEKVCLTLGLWIFDPCQMIRYQLPWVVKF